MAAMLVLLSVTMLYLLMSMTETQSWKPVSGASLSRIGESVSQDLRTLSRVSWECGRGACTVTETLSDRNATRIMLLLQQDITRGYQEIGANATPDTGQLGSTGTLFLWSENSSYQSNFSSRVIRISGFLNYSYRTGSVSCSLSEDCTEGSGKRIIINSGGCQYNALVSGSCQLNLTYPDGRIVVNYSQTELTVDYSGYSGEITVNQTFGTPGELVLSGPRTLGSTSSTSNPGYTEPDYPSSFGLAKHYGSIVLGGVTYYLIVCDNGNDSSYDYYYLSGTTDFSGEKPRASGSATFLNNKVFLITVNVTGDNVIAHDVPGFAAFKGTNLRVVRSL